MQRLSASMQLFSSTERDIIKPGVVFCLKQKGDTDGNEALNPLQPYFLVYIRNDGTVRYNYTNAKQILEIYRLMCQGRRDPYEKLCELFNSETHNSEETGQYSDLLKKAIAGIAHIFKRRAAQKLTSDRSALIIPKSKQPDDKII
jgi:hypothetical protein